MFQRHLIKRLPIVNGHKRIPLITTNQAYLSSFNNESSISLENSLKHCINLIKEKQPHTYLSIMTIPASQRPLNFALRAFMIEMASIPEHVKTSNMALIRLNWWRSAITSIQEYISFQYNMAINPDNPLSNPPEVPPEHPIIHTLSNAILFQGLGFDFSLLYKIIDIQEKWLACDTYEDLHSLVADIDAYYGSFYKLILTVGIHEEAKAEQIMDVNPEILSAAVLMGRAVGLIEVLRSAPYNSHQDYIKIPEDMLWYEGMTFDDLSKVIPEMMNITNKAFFDDLDKYKNQISLNKKKSSYSETSVQFDLGEKNLDAMLERMRRQDPKNVSKTTSVPEHHTCSQDEPNQKLEHFSESSYIPYEPTMNEFGQTIRPGIITNEFVRRQLIKTIHRFTDISEEALRKARDAGLKIPGPIRCYLLDGLYTQHSIDSLRKLNYDIYDPAFLSLNPKDMVKFQLSLGAKRLFNGL